MASSHSKDLSLGLIDLAHDSNPLSMSIASTTAWPIRLLPSTNGWLLISEKPAAAALSTRLG